MDGNEIGFDLAFATQLERRGVAAREELRSAIAFPFVDGSHAMDDVLRTEPEAGRHDRTTGFQNAAR